MKHQISTSILINAQPQKVWEVFSNFEAYPNWNPFIKSIKGLVQVGNKITAEIGNMTFKPTVLVYQQEREFTWQGKLFLPGIFDGKHSFILQDNNDGTTTFIHQENFKGLLVGMMKKKLDTEVLEGFKALNLQLKKLVEEKELRP